MSENLQLLQALAQKPSVQDWFTQRFTVVHLDVTDTGEQFTLVNPGDHAEVLSGFQTPTRKRKGLLARLGFDPIGWYQQQFIVPIESQNIRNLVDVFADDVVDIVEQYQIVSFLITPLLRAAFAMPILQNQILLRLLGIYPFWQQTLLDPEGHETQPLTAIFTYNQWLLIPGYHGKPYKRYVLKPEQILDLQRRAHEAEQKDSLAGFLELLRWFRRWRNSITVH